MRARASPMRSLVSGWLAQVREAAAVVEPRRLVEQLEHLRHAGGREAGAGHHREADAVGLALDVAREIELTLRRGGLRADDRGVGRIGAAGAAGRQQPDDHRRQARHRLPLAGRNAARDVALRDVRQLVREHRGELVAIRGDRDQTEVDADVAAGQRERIDLGVAHQERLPGEALVDLGADVAAAPRLGHQRLPDRLQVLSPRSWLSPGRNSPENASAGPLGATTELCSRVRPLSQCDRSAHADSAARACYHSARGGHDPICIRTTRSAACCEPRST